MTSHKPKKGSHNHYAVLAILLGVVLFVLLLVQYQQKENSRTISGGAETAKQEYARQADDLGFAFEEVTEGQDLKAPKQIDIKIQNGVPEHGIALIIDDVGYDLRALNRLLELPFPVAISVLPDAPEATEAARRAHEAGSVVMLHLPMEPTTPKYREKMNDAFLTSEMEESELILRFRKLLERVPYSVGVNNHMGSLLTTIPEAMRLVMELCRERNLFFIDSKTSSASVAADMAKESGISWGVRRIFLDHSIEPDALRMAWLSARKCVERHASCIVIAHPHAETLDFLEQQISQEDFAMIHPVTSMLHGGGGS